VNRCLVLDPVPRSACALTVFCGVAIGVCVLGIALLVAGCGANTPPNRYTVFVDPTITEADELAIGEALASWQNVTGKAWLDLSYPALCPQDIHPGDICVRYGAGGDVGGITEVWDNGRAYIWLRSPVTLQAAAHELGHAQGIYNHLGPGTVMCANTGCAAEDVTPADAVAWERER